MPVMPLPPRREGQIALITGASSGIGAEFARQLAARGYRVALVARRAERLERLAAELGGEARAVAIAADLADPDARERLATRLEQLGAAVEILVNNAGFGLYTEFAAEGRERELAQVRLDVEAVVDLMARYLPSMLASRRGAVINMSSTAGFQPLPYNASYAAAKAYVLWLSEAVHEEARERGVTVTAVCPGPVPTEFQAVNRAEFSKRLPRPLWVSPQRVAADALAAAEEGRRWVIPGGPHVKAAFAPSRVAPSGLSLAFTKRLMRT
jgi:short-subunit dehydrogenase